MNFKSIADMSKDVKEKLLMKLPRDISVVYGVPRSGLLPASIIATALGADLAVVGSDSVSGSRSSSFINKVNEGRALVVDDTMYRGGAMRKALSVLGKKCSTCVVYVSPESKHLVDYFAEVLPGPRFFEWNFNGIKATEGFVFDMDGVICEDPRVFDDDGPEYQKEIATGVRPKYIPQVKIKAICTNRIERWRPETEAWLKRNNVSYGELIMQPYKTAEERRKKSSPSVMKSEYFGKNGSVFVESHDRHASKISELTKKPVLSIESMRLF